MIMRSLVTAVFGDPLYIPSVALEGVVGKNRIKFSFPGEAALIIQKWLCRVGDKLCWLDPIGNDWLA